MPSIATPPPTALPSRIRTLAVGKSYHSSLPAGTLATATRENLAMAVALLRDEPAAAGDALAIIDAILAVQDRDPASPTFGVWPYYLEEPLARMTPPDWNWADFLGSRLCELLIEPPAGLTADIALRGREAVGCAAWSIFRRNVGPDYTNICVLGGVVCQLAGELLDLPVLRAYALSRLRSFLDRLETVGGMAEYNSPTYNIVVMEAAEQGLRLARDPAVVPVLDGILRRLWEGIAQHWHQPTGQWGGPHSRAYGDVVAPWIAAVLSAKTGADIRPLGAVAQPAPAWAVQGPPCPPDLVHAFATPPAGARRVEQRFALAVPGGSPEVRGTTWMDGQACLGSVSADSLWYQCRPLIGYWRSDAGVAVLRARLLKDGQDLAAGALRCVQDGPRVLAVAGLFTDRGDWHLGLDRPADGIYRGSSLVLRIQLSGPAAQCQEVASGRWLLSAGSRRALIIPGPGAWGAQRPHWRAGAADGLAWVEADLAGREGFALDPEALGAAALPLGIKVLAPGEEPSAGEVESRCAATGVASCTWDGLRLDTPLVPRPYRLG